MRKGRAPGVGIAKFKARLSEYLRAVRRGQPVTLLDRDTPVARVVPFDDERQPLSVRKPIRRLQDVPLPPPLGTRVDSLALLLEERSGDTHDAALALAARACGQEVMGV